MEITLYRLTRPIVGGISYGLRFVDDKGIERQRIVGHKTSLLRLVWNDAEEGKSIQFYTDKTALL